MRGAANAYTDLALVPAKLQPAGLGAQAGSSVAGGVSVDGSGVDGLIAAPGASGAFIVNAAGMLNPPVPPVIAPPAPPVAPAAPVVAPATPATPATPKKTVLKLCPLKAPKPVYKVVNGKKVKVKPAPCLARKQAKSKAGARGGHAITVAVKAAK